jgi:hypothetical protein
MATTIPSVPALLLVFLAPFCRRGARLRVVTLLAVGAFFFCASYPDDLPVYGWLRSLPVLGDFRFPFRYRLVSLLVISVLAGVGLTWIQAQLRSRRRLALGVTVGIVLLTLTPRFLSLSTSVVPFSPALATPPAIPPEFEHWTNLPERDAPLRLYWSDRSHRIGAPGKLHVLFDLEPLTLARTAELLTFLEAGRPVTVDRPQPEPQLWIPGQTSRTRVSIPFYGRSRLPASAQRSALLDLLSVDLVGAGGDRPHWLASRYQRLGPEGASSALYANPHALPRARRVHAAERAPDDLEAALRRLVSPDFDRERVVLLDDPPPSLLTHPGPEAGRPTEAVQIERYEAERVQLRTRGDRPGVVVLSDAYFPGWEARVNGEPARIHRANTAVRAVEVPEGESVVELRYRPASFRRGLWLGLLGFLGCLGLAFLDSSRRRMDRLRT